MENKEINTLDVHITFTDDGLFTWCLNGKDVEEGAKIPFAQVRVIARILSKIAVGMWNSLDNALLEEEKRKSAEK